MRMTVALPTKKPYLVLCSSIDECLGVLDDVQADAPDGTDVILEKKKHGRFWPMMIWNRRRGHWRRCAAGK